MTLDYAASRWWLIFIPRRPPPFLHFLCAAERWWREVLWMKYRCNTHWMRICNSREKCHGGFQIWSPQLFGIFTPSFSADLIYGSSLAPIQPRLPKSAERNVNETTVSAPCPSAYFHLYFPPPKKRRGRSRAVTAVVVFPFLLVEPPSRKKLTCVYFFMAS